ncbi:hypothetical protein BHE74_00052432 [Ensete ventricosum]|nr:hypothetical protein GW17_00025025 [Ensete ventricosum]RWW42047.1 hypothetical protein BHE74_00052432 [Ensete ventricosum]RZS23406.1 hypothetical protein BHM03_00056335 [Ensete ventricosum]
MEGVGLRQRRARLRGLQMREAAAAAGAMAMAILAGATKGGRWFARSSSAVAGEATEKASCGKQGGSGGQSRDGEVAEESGVVARRRGDGVVSRGVVQRLGRDVAAQLQEELAEFQPTSKETCRDGCSGGGREGLVSRYKARGKAPEQGRRSPVPDSGALQEKESGGSSDRFRSCRPKPCSSYVDGCAVRM